MNAKSRTNLSITRISLIIIFAHFVMDSGVEREGELCFYACESANASQKTEAESHLERFFEFQCLEFIWLIMETTSL